MKRFFLKTALLITLLFCAVLYGMDIAKQGMMKMEGIEKTTSSPLNFDIPGLNSKSAKADHGGSSQIKTNAQAETKTDDIGARINKLDEIHGFNAFSAMGDKLSEGVSSVCAHGIQAAASVIDHLLN